MIKNQWNAYYSDTATSIGRPLIKVPMSAFLLFAPLLSGPRLAFNRRFNCSRNLRPWRTWGVKEKIKKVETSIWKRNQIYYYPVTKLFFASYRGTFHSARNSGSFETEAIGTEISLESSRKFKNYYISQMRTFEPWIPEIPREKSNCRSYPVKSSVLYWRPVLSRFYPRVQRSIKIRENTVSSLIEWNGNSL